ncbi:MAG: citramalate synthase [Anaerolineae bacterium]|nr:citramalate synthase [Anaerolineae bacterium]
MSQVEILDTTLRDGAQAEGISFSLEDKLRIARRLDDLGIHYIEGGWPGSNPKDARFFERAGSLALRQATIVAFGSTRRADVAPAEDANLAALLAAGTPVVTLFGKSWQLHVERVLGTTLDENLRMIADSIRYLRAAGRRVIYDAEHFFDGFAANPDYALETLRAALVAGAECLVLCDTNGGTLPGRLAAAVSRVRATFPGVPLGIHAHNDSGLAVANTLAAVEAGVTHVQGTFNGYGERCGNADLCAVIPNLQLKMGLAVLAPEQLAALTEAAHFVSEVANLRPNPHAPYVGRSAFAHKGGVHVSAVLKAAESYQHIDPGLVGNERRVLVSELSGKGNILHKAAELCPDLETPTEHAREVLREVKELEARGYQFEGAEGSFELLLRRSQPGYQPPFELLDFLVLVEKRRGTGIIAEATVKARVGDEIIHTAAVGNGPVNALDRAIRKAILPFYPELDRVQLVDYKVRILDEEAATAAQTRVLIEASDGEHNWNTVGSSTNIIEASFHALVDSLELPLARANGNGRARPRASTDPVPRAQSLPEPERAGSEAGAREL